MKYKKVSVVFGKRPEAIKLAHVIQELKKTPIKVVRPEAIKAGTIKLVGTSRKNCPVFQ